MELHYKKSNFINQFNDRNIFTFFTSRRFSATPKAKAN